MIDGGEQKMTKRDEHKKSLILTKRAAELMGITFVVGLLCGASILVVVRVR